MIQCRAIAMVCLVVLVGVGCSLRKELEPVGVDGGSDAGGQVVATQHNDAASGQNSAPGGSGGSISIMTGSGGASSPGMVGSAGTGTGGAQVGTGTGGNGSGGNGVAQTQDAGSTPPGQATDGPLLMRDLGQTCSAGSDCASGNCADGVCCDSACTGSCSACNLKDFVGACTPVPADSAAPASHAACPKMAATTCKQNGLCDGKGACELYASGEVCGGGSCSATTQSAVTGSTCDGLGACKPAAAVACAPFKCKADGTGCASSCVTDTDCQGQPCVAGSCGKVANGSKCTGAAQCTSGNCVDGYCCDLACGGSCQACDLAGAIGKCTTLPANQTPRSGRTACTAGTCGSRCDGTSTSCAFASSATSCGAAKCSAGTATAAVNCDGKGACPTAATTSCGGLVCSGTSCKTSCSADTDCLAGTPYCNAGKCQAGKPPGRSCGGGGECASGNCVDGVCCTSASCGTCQACNLGTPGTCSAKASGATDPGCTTANCQTTCNGSGACNRAPDGMMCGTNRFCRTGTCGACTPNMGCTPSNPCKTGTTSCTTGTMICNETGNMAPNTPCGAGATCSSSTKVKTSAAVCNSAGACSTTQTTCAAGCNAAGNDCLTCQAGQVACSSMCCSGSTPACLVNACVQCIADANCTLTGQVCDTTKHTCGCRKKSSTNLLPDPGFDTGLAGWSQGQLGTADADGCAGSKSLSAGGGQFCQKVNPSTFYFFGAKVRGAGYCYLWTYSDNFCAVPWIPSGSDMPAALGRIGDSANTSIWLSYGTDLTTDPAVNSLLINCYNLEVDQIYLSSTAAGF